MGDARSARLLHVPDGLDCGPGATSIGDNNSTARVEPGELVTDLVARLALMTRTAAVVSLRERQALRRGKARESVTYYTSCGWPKNKKCGLCSSFHDPAQHGLVLEQLVAMGKVAGLTKTQIARIERLGGTQ